MKHNLFSIGVHFYTNTGKWRCTDVGQRTIIAIKIDKGTIVTMVDGVTTKRQTGYEGEDFSWLNGPPYAVAERVFDEYDLEGCSFADIREETHDSQ